MSQAFPTMERGGAGLDLADPGMTLRDYFAAKAVVGILGMVAAGRHDTQKFDGSTPEEAIAADAYRLADAMLKARKAGASDKGETTND